MIEDSNPISKSCEVLFECLKPYQDLIKSKGKSVTNQNVRRILERSDITDNATAKRKVQFLSICEEAPDDQPHFSGYNTSIRLFYALL